MSAERFHAFFYAPMMTQEQLIHYVVGEILDELECYDCSELFWKQCCVVVHNYHQRYGPFDPTQEGTFDQYQDLFFEALELVRLLANAQQEQD